MPRTFEHVLKSNSKTFYIASRLLPKYVRRDVFKVYSFCRLYDDNVDLDRKDDTNDLEEYILNQMAQLKDTKHISYFGFSGTPKKKTLEM